MNMRDEIAWSCQHKDADKHGHGVEHENDKRVEFGRNGIHIVCGWVELGESRKFLQQNYANAEYVANYQSFAYDECSEP